MRHLSSVFKTTYGMALCYLCQSMCAGPRMCSSVHTRMCHVDARGQPWMLLLRYHLHPSCFEIRTLTGWELTKNRLGGREPRYLPVSACSVQTSMTTFFLHHSRPPGRLCTSRQVSAHPTCWCLSIELKSRGMLVIKAYANLGPSCQFHFSLCRVVMPTCLVPGHTS